MFDELTGEYIGHHPLGRIDFKAERKDKKEWYNNLPEHRKAVMAAFPRFTCAQTRMRLIAEFLRTVGYEQTPKADIQYEIAFEKLEELKAWLSSKQS